MDDVTQADLLREMQQAIGPDIYHGPGAFTADELAVGTTFSAETQRRRAHALAERGEWIEVIVRRVVNGRKVTKQGWVDAAIYKRWEKRGSGGDQPAISGGAPFPDLD